VIENRTFKFNREPFCANQLTVVTVRHNYGVFSACLHDSWWTGAIMSGLWRVSVITNYA